MRISGRKIFAFLLLFVVFIDFSHSAKKKKNSSKSDGSVELAVPDDAKRSYFSKIDESIVRLVEDGSPESLKKAISLLSADEKSDEKVKILSNVAYSMLSICWPSEKISVSLPAAPNSNPYIGSINSAKQGIYDYSTGGADFLALVLPSLVLSTSSMRNDYFDDSRRDLEKARSLRSDSVFLNYLLGLLFTRTGDFQSAETYLSAARKNSPRTREILAAYARSLLENKKYGESFAIARGLCEENPGDRNFLKLCAESSFGAKDYSSAEVYVGKVLQQEPENARYILFRAKILVLRGEYIKASSLLDVYSRTDSKAKDYLLLRSTIQREWNKNNSLAAATIEEAFALYPNDIDVILAAAAVASETGGLVGGRSAGYLASKVLSSDKKNVDALEILAKDFANKSDWASAYRTSSELVKIPGAKDSALFTHISICLSFGQKAEAWELASKLYSEKPDDENVVQAYVTTLVSTGRASEASKLIASLIPASSAKQKSFLYYQKSLLSTGEENILADLRSSLIANPRNRDSLFRLYTIYFNKKEYRKAQYYLKQVVAISPDDEKVRELDENLKSLLSK